MDANNNMNNMNAAANTKIDDKVLKKVVGEEIAKIDGVLSTGGGFLNMFKSDDNVTAGISVCISDANRATVDAKVITEAGKNIPDIVNQITENVSKALQDVAGLQTDAVNVEVADTMSRDKYNEKYASDTTDPAYVDPNTATMGNPPVQ